MPSHAYAYDYSTAYPTNNYEYTVDLTDGEFTTVCYNSVAVLPAPVGDPSIDLSLPSTIEEGQTFTPTVNFSDPALPDDTYGMLGTFYFGDGTTGGFNTTDATQTSDYAYTEPGTYVVTAGGWFAEDDSNFHCAYTSSTIVVTDATPTITVTNDDPEINRGDDFSLTASFSDPMNEDVTGWRIAWGDGSTSYDPLPASPFDGTDYFDHTYTEAGSHEVDVIATSADGTFSTSTDVTVDDPQPNVSLWSTDGDAEATESGQSPGRLYITRDDSGNTSDSLVVNYSLGGTLPSTAYIVSEQDTNQILTGSVTLPAGVMSETLLVTPLEDNTPRWTQTVDASLTSGDYSIDSANSAAGVYVTDDDAEVYIANGSGNLILDGSSDGKSNLVPLVLNVPHTRDGAQITLTCSADSEVDVWTTASPGSTDQPILGDVNGTLVSSYVFTQGTTPNAPDGLTTYWVGGTGGSAMIDDIHFDIATSDASCGLSGTDANPQVPAPAPPSPPASPPVTSNSDESRGDSAIELEIISLNDPNPLDAVGDVTGVERNWLVGQMVDVQARLVGPSGIRLPRPVSWTLDDPEDVLLDYSDDNEAASERPLLSTNSDGTGLARPELRFFWVATNDTSSPSVVRTVSVAVGGLSAQTTFDVFEPISSLDVVEQGRTSVFPLANSQAISLSVPGVFGIRGTPGIGQNASVQLPDGGSFDPEIQGEWKFLQLVTLHQEVSAVLLAGGALNNLQLNLDGETVLDHSDPYSQIEDASGSVFATSDMYAEMTDSPLQPLASPNGYYISDETYRATFETFVMFRPPSGSRESVWVPVRYQDWYWDFDSRKATFLAMPVLTNVRGPDPGDPEAAGPWEPLWVHNSDEFSF